MKTLLLADDSVTIQRVIELTFAHEDVRVISVSDGRRALQWMETEIPDIVLADVQVPDIDGYAMAAHIKQSPRLQGVPVLLLAGAFEPVDQERVRSLGCDGVLVKPFEPQQLVSRVKALLERAATPVIAPPMRQPERISDLDLGSVTPFSRPTRSYGSEFASAFNDPDPQPLEPPMRPVWEGAPAAPVRIERLDPPTTTRVSLANAFSALLAAEQLTQPSPAAAPFVAAPLSDETIDAAIRRVLDAKTDDHIREIVDDRVGQIVGDRVNQAAGRRVNEIADERVSRVADERVSEIADDRVRQAVDERVSRAVDERVGQVLDDHVGRVVGERAGYAIEDHVGRVVGERVGQAIDDRVGHAVNERASQAIDEHVSRVVGERVGGAIDERVTQVVGDRAERAIGDHVGRVVDERVDQAIADRVSQVVAERVGQVISDRVSQAVDERIAGVIDDRVNQVASERVGQVVDDRVSSVLDQRVTQIANERIGLIIDDRVSRIVTEIAERLVREEIEKIKARPE